MQFYQNLNLTRKLILTFSFLLPASFTLYLLPQKSGNVFLALTTFILIFAGLYSLFNIVKLKLYTKVFLGLALGMVAGIVFGEGILVFQPVGVVFIKLIKMIVIPLVFASLLVGTASLNDIRKLGRIGLQTLLFYLVSTAIAISIGLFIANIIQPGATIPESVKLEINLDYAGEAQDKVSQIESTPSVVDILTGIIPENPFAAMAQGQMLPVIFFALMGGIAVAQLTKGKSELLTSFFSSVSDIMILMVHMIMKLAPYGVFALISAVIAQFGIDILKTLFAYFLTTILALMIHVSLFNSLVIKLFSDLKIKSFWRGIYPALLVAFSSSSSSATLPVTMDCAENNLQVRPDIASFVLPLGSTINMDGTAIFQGVSAVFIAAVYGIELTLIDQLTIILTATLASIGTAGAPQVGIIMLTLVLQTIGIPLEGIALILGVERLLDMARTTVNVSSDLSCSVFINYRRL